MSRNLLPTMVGVSRNCGHTQNLHRILTEKLSETDLLTLNAWLKIVEEERQLIKDQAVRAAVRGMPHSFGRH